MMAQCINCGGHVRTGFQFTERMEVCKRCRSTIPWIEQIVCRVCGRAVFCPDCLRDENRKSALMMNRSAVMYHNVMKEWLARYKYRGDERMGILLGSMLAFAWKQLVEAVHFQKNEQIILSYVPLSRERMQERGFNQAREMAIQLGERCGLPIYPLLHRRWDTGKQSQRSRSERQRELSEAIGVLSGTGFDILHGARANRPISVVIVDDVYTTGSTLMQCAAALKSTAPHCRIFGLTWARS